MMMTSPQGAPLGGQHAENYLPELQRWAQARGVNVVRVFLVEDSASNEGKAGGKGGEFDAARAELVEGARMGRWSVALIWSLDRLSRRGYTDLSAVLDKLRGYGCEVWSHQEEWLSTIGPFGEIVIHMLAWMAQQQMAEHSAKVRLGMIRARDVEGQVIGGRKPGSKDKRPGARERRGQAVRDAWNGPSGEARRKALGPRNRARAAASR
jgi:DNA invertase Pin-like site-specific DNA recombinase